jgi:hypothetical protein
MKNIGHFLLTTCLLLFGNSIQAGQDIEKIIRNKIDILNNTKMNVAKFEHEILAQALLNLQTKKNTYTYPNCLVEKKAKALEQKDSLENIWKVLSIHNIWETCVPSKENLASSIGFAFAFTLTMAYFDWMICWAKDIYHPFAFVSDKKKREKLAHSLSLGVLAGGFCGYIINVSLKTAKKLGECNREIASYQEQDKQFCSSVDATRSLLEECLKHPEICKTKFDEQAKNNFWHNVHEQSDFLVQKKKILT